MKTPLLLPLAACAALATLTLTGCKPSTSPLQPYAYERYDLNATDSGAFRNECVNLLEHYEATGDIHYATPRYQMTLLHLAAFAHQLPMVQYLLQEGADAKALMQPLEDGQAPLSPIGAALCNISRMNPAPTNDALMTIQALLAGGAELQAEGAASPLLCCAQSYGDYFGTPTCMGGEVLAQELIRLGARGGQAEALAFALRAWPQALASLLASLPEAEAAALRQDAALLRPCMERAFRHNGVKPRKVLNDVQRFKGIRYDGAEKRAALACAATLLGDTRAEGAGSAPQVLLGEMAQRVAELREKDDFSPQTAACFIALLMEHGGDPSLPLAEGQPAAADIFASHGQLRAALAECGVALPMP